MRRAYALLGIMFMLVLVGAYIAVQRSNAPETSSSNTAPEPEREPDKESAMSFTLTSPAFAENAIIPSHFTCDGENVSPPLSWKNAPADVQSFVLVMDDPDIPQVFKESRGLDAFDHWVLYNIPIDTEEIPEGESRGEVGQNGAGTTAYTGPCPPPEYEPAEHRYRFRLYALSGTLHFIAAPTLDEVETAAKSMMLGSAELIGRYERAAQ